MASAGGGCRLLMKWCSIWLILACAVLGSHVTQKHAIRHSRSKRQYHFPQNITLGSESNFEESGPWGPWTTTSICSRTCGGGVSFQSRVCEDFTSDGRHGCTGPSKRYFSCNIQDCPEGSRDFREEQCARFNSLPFEGKFYSWVPYHKTANPCELNCMPKGERFYFRHSNKAIDGTRCKDDGSLDVCVDGICMPVGCDMMLGSTAKEDKCRECGGDGSGCNTIEGIFDLDNLQVGYNDILLIPPGATNIRIEEKEPTNNYLAVRNVSGHYYLNGHWRIEFPRSLKFAGTIFHYERKTHGLAAPESILSLGPTTEAILIVLLYQEKNLGITYEYSIPAGFGSVHPDTYSWSFGDYTECTQTCGGGIQIRPVYCSSASSYERVPDDLCNPQTKPATNRSCNTQSCPASWYTGTWQKCSQSCGNGTQLRLVFCHHLTETGIIILNDSQCSEIGPKPVAIQECSSEETCAVWEAGEWSECDKICGEGTQIRDVQCITPVNDTAVEIADESDCDEEKRPESNQTCSLRPCDGVEWIVTDWRGCDGSCASEIAVRDTVCAVEDGIVYPNDLCDENRKPNTTKECEQPVDCEFMWYASQWSECSSECGTGIQTRKVFCGVWENDTLKTVSEDNCDLEKKFESNQECSSGSCNGTWFIAPWNRCTTPCGGGTRNRAVVCHKDGKPIAENQCDPTNKPFEDESCNAHACDEDQIISTGGCKDSEHGCCPDGMTPAGPNFEHCPKVDIPEGGCENTEFGCCFDDATPAFGPFKKGCVKLSSCNFTTYGCCPDGETPAEGPDQEGCLEIIFTGDCNATEFGCCPDGITAIQSLNDTGCPEPVLKPCNESQFGCCPDNYTSADGPDYLGCLEGSGSGAGCDETEFGCCPDGVTPADGPNNLGCPGKKRCVLTNTTLSIDFEGSGMEPIDCEEDIPCSETPFGCCPDDKTPAKGENFEGCGNCTNSTYGCCPDGFTEAQGLAFEGCPEEACENSTYGCCPDGTTTALGDNLEGCDIYDCLNSTYGCCPDGITAAQGDNFTGCDNCTFAVFGCCPDGVNTAIGPDFEGCIIESDCLNTTYGCCPDNITPAQGENFTGCVVSECANSTYGCCPDNVTEASGPDNDGCCFSSEFGCCPDNRTIALGPDFAGCGCGTTEHGCCPDGITVALGPRYYGCTCEHYPYGCCQDNHTPAGGPHYEGCVCERMLYHCCPDGITPAQGEHFQGCFCNTTRFGCCPDGRTPASGPGYQGCTCATMPYGCCPDRSTPARGPNFGGCPCNTMPYGCCQDRQTPATGPNFYGCECTNLVHGCCPDGRTPSQGPNYLGCPCESFPYGCCQDRITPSRGPNYAGCTCANTPYGCCPDGINTAHGPNFEGCPDISGMKKMVKGDVCSLSRELGPCRNYTVKWFFDMDYGGCSRFWYGGCDGNGNRFESQKDCENVCVKPEGPGACLLPRVVGPCEGKFEYWYFDSTTKTCDTFVYSGCLGNNNRFASKEICEHTCLDQKDLDPCEYPVDTGPCRGSFPRWHYDRYDNRCKQFAYGGCQGNSNNFVTERECQDRCVTLSAREVCILPKVEGSCLGQFRNYYYDYVDGHCKEFIYTGCQGNRNRFETKSHCERMCNATRVAVSADICSLAKDEGPCRAAILHWYYNTAASRCEQFYYGGCQGNVNRFETRRECERACLPSGGRNICLQPQEVGNCFEFRERWHYNAEDSRCHRFYYSGCGGNDNNFGSYLECEQSCGRPTSTEVPEDEFKIEYCFLSHESGPCSNTEIRWFYDKSDGVCREFYYGGCLGNGNRFRTRTECEQKCGSAQDICSLPVVQGPCRGSFMQFYYDPETDTCREFKYSGCQGNANRFNSKETCDAQCTKGTFLTTTTTAPLVPVAPTPSPEACQQTREPGPCLGHFEVFYYDPDDNACKPFIYGGCEGNDNRFQTIEECESNCIRTGPISRERYPDRPKPTPLFPEANEDVCKKMVDSGTCTETHARWFYDAKSTTCLPFVYSGCGGNKNRFKSFEVCKKFCEGIKDDGTGDEEDERLNRLFDEDDDDEEDTTGTSDVEVQVQPTVPPQCPPSNCLQIQCPLGISEIVEGPGCIRCRCTDPCEGFTCADDQRCRIEAYRGPDGEPHYQPICRLVTKNGHCPVAEEFAQPAAVVRTDCRDVCRIDADCPGERKCCYNGCAHTCVDPILTESDTTTTVSPTTSVYVPPHIEESEPEIIATAGADSTLRCTARGIPTPTVYWTRDGNSVQSEEGRFKILVDGSLRILYLRQEDAGLYTCTADNGQGIPARHVVKLIVFEDVAADIVIASTEYKIGKPLQLDCRVRGYPAPEVIWYFNDTRIKKGNHYKIYENHTLYIDPAGMSDSGVYKCDAANDVSEASSSVVINIDEMHVPESCTDNPSFANCNLIVRVQYCSNPHYGEFCCRSCLLAGQISREQVLNRSSRSS